MQKMVARRKLLLNLRDAQGGSTMKLLGIPASNSIQSINGQLVRLALDWTTDMLDASADKAVLDLNAYEMPIYSIDRETADGVPLEAQAFLDEIAAADALLISFAEHNGSYTAAFKNIFDWASRLNGKVYQDKPVVMMATSPGKRGGAAVLSAATTAAPFFGATLVGSYSLGSFGEAFDSDNGIITDEQKENELRAVLRELVSHLSQ
ncbi:MAG: NAD(P)H-dependent oxidoreductase [Pseudomonadota bacterium]